MYTCQCIRVFFAEPGINIVSPGHIGKLFVLLLTFFWGNTTFSANVDDFCVHFIILIQFYEWLMIKQKPSITLINRLVNLNFCGAITLVYFSPVYLNKISRMTYCSWSGLHVGLYCNVIGWTVIGLNCPISIPSSSIRQNNVCFTHKTWFIPSSQPTKPVTKGDQKFVRGQFVDLHPATAVGADFDFDLSPSRGIDTSENWH